MSEIKVDKISPQSGTALAVGDSGDTITIPSGATITNSGTANGFGAASLKTVQTHLTATSSQSISVTTVANITNLNATITPTAGTQILITVRWNGEGSDASNNQDNMFGLKRDTTVIGSPATAGSRRCYIAQGFVGYTAADASSTCDGVMYQYLDSPSTGSAITYHATFSNPTAQTLYNQRTVGDADSAASERLTSTITLQEVVAP